MSKAVVQHENYSGCFLRNVPWSNGDMKFDGIDNGYPVGAVSLRRLDDRSPGLGVPYLYLPYARERDRSSICWRITWSKREQLWVWYGPSKSPAPTGRVTGHPLLAHAGTSCRSISDLSFLRDNASEGLTPKKPLLVAHQTRLETFCEL